MDVSKNSGVENPPKMDGENNNEQMDDLGGGPIYFWKHPNSNVWYLTQPMANL